MPVFLGIHEMGRSGTDEEVAKAWEAYKVACEKAGCKPWKAYYNAEQGRAWCVTEAASADEVQKAHDDAQVPIKEILEVKKLK
jgi:uncharacterized protein DUF4242